MFGIVSTVGVGVCLFGRVIWLGLRRLCKGVYKPVGRHAKTVGFTEVEQINAYVPGVRWNGAGGSLDRFRLGLLWWRVLIDSGRPPSTLCLMDVFAESIRHAVITFLRYHRV